LTNAPFSVSSAIWRLLGFRMGRFGWIRDGRAVLPPALARWPATLLMAAQTGVRCGAEAGAEGALSRIREEKLFWPAPRARARRARVAAFDARGLAAARARYDDAQILRANRPEEVDPETLEAVFGGGPEIRRWSTMGGLAGDRAQALAMLAAAAGRSPWTGEPLSLSEALDAQALLRHAAATARGPVGLYGMSPWKRSCLRPFLTGPDGPPRALRDAAAALAHNGPLAAWGVAEPNGRSPDLRVEDGFLRSVGLGLRHAPPLSLNISPWPLHFDATRRNGFDALAESLEADDALLDRARRLRARVVALGLTKYNLRGRDAAPPDPGGRLAILAPGQVENDASIQLGARAVRRNLDLLAATRARFPDAFIAFKPHPDVLTGLRPGHVPPDQALLHADCIVEAVSADACLVWADRIATMTSLMGFEALLRGKAATCFGRPFYSGWGLTDDADPPPRARELTLDELTAAALILYPRYVDPGTGLPTTPEVAVDALAESILRSQSAAARFVTAWQNFVSWTLNRLG
jgi:capsular polysaccharide export protein